MAYVNVGALVNNERPKTKAALKRAVKESPESVVFDNTSAFVRESGERGEYVPSPDRHNSIEKGVTLVVTGPDPYSKRNWYANVKLDRNGKVVVS